MASALKVIGGGLLAASLGFALGRAGGIRAEPAEPLAREAAQGEPVGEQFGRVAHKGGEANPSGWRAWAERIAAAETAADLEALFAEADSIEKGSRLAGEARAMLAVRWVEIDPVAGLRFLNSETPTWPVTWQRKMLLTEWAMADREAACAAIVAMGGRQTKDAAKFMLEGLQSRDPARALECVVALGDFGPTGGWLEAARTDPARFAELVPRLRERMSEGTGSTGTRDLLRAAGKAFAEIDADRALAWARELPDWMRDDGVGSVVEEIAATDHERAAELFAELTGKPHGNAQSAARRAIGRAKVLEDLESGLDWSFENRVMIGLMLTRLIESGDVSAGDLYHSFKARKTIGWGASTSTFDELPGSALAEVRELIVADEDHRDRMAIARTLVDEAAWRDVDAGIALCLELDGEARESAVAALGNRLQQFGIGALEGLPAADRPVAVTALFGKRFSHWPASPASIGDLLSEAPPSGELSAAAGRLALHWGASDPQAALDWAGTLGYESAARVAAEEAVDAWATLDPGSLSRYLIDVPPGAVRDGAIGGLAHALRSSDPEAATAWAQQISDEDYRTHVFENFTSAEDAQ